jgi:hypothetical protein
VSLNPDIQLNSRVGAILHKKGNDVTYYTLSITEDEWPVGKSISLKGRSCQYNSAARIESTKLATAFKELALLKLKRKHNNSVDIAIVETTTNWTKKRENRIQADSKIITGLLNNRIHSGSRE